MTPYLLKTTPHIPWILLHVHSSLGGLSNFNFLLKPLVSKPNEVVEEACNIEHTSNDGTEACEEVPKRPEKKLYLLQLLVIITDNATLHHKHIMYFNIHINTYIIINNGDLCPARPGWRATHFCLSFWQI